jgi:hypothetical protein
MEFVLVLILVTVLILILETYANTHLIVTK